MNEKGSISFTLVVLLGIIFIVLKVTNTVDWPWIAVLSPYWGMLLAMIFFGLFWLMIIFFSWLLLSRGRRYR